MDTSRDSRLGEMDVITKLTQLIGRTPLIQMTRYAAPAKPLILVKYEGANIGGSAKDRIALEMILAAEKSGELKPGGTIVEPTSGNTGVGLAIVAAERGYKCVFVVSDKVAPEKISLLRAYGAQVHVCPYAVEPEHPESYYSVAKRVKEETPNSYQPDQYSNPNNPLAHEKTTGPEIWEQTKGRITHFVAGAGTGGTLVGVSRFLKSKNPSVQIVAADPEGSVYSGGTGRPYLVEGVGEDFWPATYDPSAIDRVIAISDAESFNTARNFARTEGLLIGGSGGLAVAAAVRLSHELTEDDVIVVLLPDSGRGYLSKLYNDEWMSGLGFTRAEGPLVGDLISSRTVQLPKLVHLHPEETIKQAIALFREYGVSQVPVVKHEPPLALAEIVGRVEEHTLVQSAFNDPSILDNPVASVMDKPMPIVGVGENLVELVKTFEKSNGVVVVDDGHPLAVLTASDVLDFLSRQNH